MRNRSGDPFKPSTLRGYEEALKLRVLPALGARKLRDITRGELQRFVKTLDGSPQTKRNTLMPLRAIYADALAHDEAAANPTGGLRLPASNGKREVRVETPADAQKLIERAPAHDRALWATALYAGLRLGELRALRPGCGAGRKFQTVERARRTMPARRPEPRSILTRARGIGPSSAPESCRASPRREERSRAHASSSSSRPPVQARPKVAQAFARLGSEVALDEMAPNF